MSAHYKQPLDFNDKLLKDCNDILNKWYQVYFPIKTYTEIPGEIFLPLLDDLNTGQIKTGSCSRSDGTAKYNQLLRIEDQLKGKCEFAGLSTFKISS